MSEMQKIEKSHMKENTEDLEATQKLADVRKVAREALNGRAVITRPLPEVVSPDADLVKKARVAPVQPATLPTSKFPSRDRAAIHALQEQCRQFCFATFFRQQDPIRCLGITSAIAAEGRSLLSVIMAQMLAADSSSPVVLMECNWEHSSLHKYFAIPQQPGLTEWLLKERKEDEIGHKAGDNLMVIPAGNHRRDGVKLLREMQIRAVLDKLVRTNHLVIVDLPPVITTPYGAMAASMVEALALVVRAGVTPAPLVSEACTRLHGLQIEGVILNQVRSRIPRWLQHIL